MKERLELIERQVQRANVIAENHEDIDPEKNLSGLIIDVVLSMMHLARVNRENFEQLLRAARYEYEDDLNALK